MEKYLHHFLRLINENRYFDAHEILEEYWFPKRKEKKPQILVIKGFINASVAFELIKRGKKEQAIKVWKNFLKYKTNIPISPKKLQKILFEVADILEKKYIKLIS